MRYQSSSAISYVFRNFLRYFYIVLPVAIYMSIYANFSKQTEFLAQWFGGNLQRDTYVGFMQDSFLLVSQTSVWWQALVAFALIVVTFSLLTVKVSRHMRVGGFTIFPIKSALKVMLPMAIFCAMFVVGAILMEFAIFGIALGISEILPIDAVVAIALALVLLTKLLLAYAWMLLLCSFPLYYNENYPFNVALSYSAREMSKKQGLCIGHAFLYLGIYLLTVALDLLLPVVSRIVYGALFAMVMYYVPCLGFTIHHENLGSERKDVARVLIG